MERGGPVAITFALVGAARKEFGSLKLEDLAEHVVLALETGQSVRLGFYDCGYPESVEFWPEQVADEEGFRHTSMKAFSGEIGAERKFPACLIISERDGTPEAAITWIFLR